MILGEIFRQMPQHFDSQQAADIDATVEWRILENEGNGHDAWHLIVHQGRCHVHAGAAETPSVTFEINGVDFIRLITGRASGPKLFLIGRLKIKGNLILAARMPRLFNIPDEQ